MAREYDSPRLEAEDLQKAFEKIGEHNDFAGYVDGTPGFMTLDGTFDMEEVLELAYRIAENRDDEEEEEEYD